jgi:hypothetical protein
LGYGGFAGGIIVMLAVDKNAQRLKSVLLQPV